MFLKYFFSTIFYAIFISNTFAQPIHATGVVEIDTTTGYYANNTFVTENVFNERQDLNKYLYYAPGEPFFLQQASSTFDRYGPDSTWTLLPNNPAQLVESTVEIGFMPTPYLKLSTTASDSAKADYESQPYYMQTELGAVTQTRIASPEIFRSALSSSDLEYLFSIKSTANSRVPINFSSLVQFSAPYTTYSKHSARLQLRSTTSSSDDLDFSILLENSISAQNMYSFEVETTFGQFGRIGFSGDPIPALGQGFLQSFETLASGTFYVQTDKNGNGSAWVHMYGTAENGSTFIDPLLSIDQSFLDQNPNSVIVLPEGIGNFAATIPELSTYLQFLFGLMCLTLVKVCKNQ